MRFSIMSAHSVLISEDEFFLMMCINSACFKILFVKVEVCYSKLSEL